ncbi:hypothetical protein E0Z10_g6208 [Xylaria hypoxylon]|uniref:C3H1-type domain-containing protein n=1 Tax=Xylaria hypoxylon TaxID=37992 RepID=A0A4Z0YE92_9PEZI|nr:hypothetical protein E0Z10_g6208 [Xylaria hypoxylon]
MVSSYGNGRKKEKQSKRRNEAVQFTIPASQSLPQITLPLYYIERQGVTHHMASGTIMQPGPNVPLIAVDQLPPWVNVLGVPCELGREQATNLSSLGVVPRGKPYEVYTTPAHVSKVPGSQMDPTAQPFTSQKGRLASELTILSGNGSPQMKHDIISAGRARNIVGDRPLIGLHERLPSPAPLEPPPGNPYPVMYTTAPYGTGGAIQRQRDSEEHPAERLLHASYRSGFGHAGAAEHAPLFPFSSCSSTSSVSSSSTATITAKKSKPRCCHWYRSGTCRFGELCRYHHEMPETTQGLQEVGSESHPPWRAQLMSQHVQNNADSNPNAVRQHTRSGVVIGSDVGIMGDIPGLYTYPMHMNTAAAAAAGASMQGIPSGYLGRQHLHTQVQAQQFRDNALSINSSSYTSAFGHDSPSSQPSSRREKKKKGKPALPPQQQQKQRQDKSRDVEDKNTASHGSDGSDDNSDTGTPIAGDKCHQHRASRTTTKKAKAKAGKNRERRGSSMSTLASPDPSHNATTRDLSRRPSASLSADSSENADDTLATKRASSPSTHKKGHQSHSSRFPSEARDKDRNQDPTSKTTAAGQYPEESDHQPRSQTRDPPRLRHVSYSPDILEQEIALAEAVEEEKWKAKVKTEAKAEGRTVPTETSTSAGEDGKMDGSHEGQRTEAHKDGDEIEDLISF